MLTCQVYLLPASNVYAPLRRGLLQLPEALVLKQASAAQIKSYQIRATRRWFVIVMTSKPVCLDLICHSACFLTQRLHSSYPLHSPPHPTPHTRQTPLLYFRVNDKYMHVTGSCKLFRRCRRATTKGTCYPGMLHPNLKHTAAVQYTAGLFFERLTFVS